MVVTIEIARRLPSLAVDYVLAAMAAQLLAKHGSKEQCGWLEPLGSGSHVHAFAITEPSGGTDVTQTGTRAVLDGDVWRITGHKQWISLAEHANLLYVLARTDPPDTPGRLARGLSLLAVEVPQPGIVVTRIPVEGMRASGVCDVVFDGAQAPADCLVGERGRGLHALSGTLALERTLAAALSVGISTAVLEFATNYAKDRMAFGRPVGGFQAVQHPIVESVAGLASSMLMLEWATRLVEEDSDAIAVASLAKLVASKTAAQAADNAMRLFGAAGYASELLVQMWFGDSRLQLFSPVTNEMVKNILGEAIGLPRSY